MLFPLPATQHWGKEMGLAGVSLRRFTCEQSEGLFQASSAREMLSQASREELGPCLLQAHEFS